MPSSEERRRLSGRYDKAHGFAGGNDEPTADTTQIVAGPTGSEIDLTARSAFHRPDADDAFRLWNLAPLLPPDQRFTRVFKGRGELIDHLFASHRLVNPANLPTVRTIRIPVTVTIRDARPAPLFLHLAIDLLPLLLILAALWHLWGLLRSANSPKSRRFDVETPLPINTMRRGPSATLTSRCCGATRSGGDHKIGSADGCWEGADR